MSEYYSDAIDKQVEATLKLYKKYLELNEKLKKWKDEWQEQVQKATDEGYARTLQTMQLNKAKDILQRLMENQPTPSSMYAEIDLVGWREVNKEAEQFLNEVEK